MTIYEAAGQAVHYEIGGVASCPTIVLLHSIGTSLTMWNRFLALLKTNFHLLGNDFGGHGRSSLSVHSSRLPQAKHLELNVSCLSAWECSVHFSAAITAFGGHPEPVYG